MESFLIIDVRDLIDRQKPLYQKVVVKYPFVSLREVILRCFYLPSMKRQWQSTEDIIQDRLRSLYVFDPQVCESDEFIILSENIFYSLLQLVENKVYPVLTQDVYDPDLEDLIGKEFSGLYTLLAQVTKNADPYRY